MQDIKTESRLNSDKVTDALNTHTHSHTYPHTHTLKNREGQA